MSIYAGKLLPAKARRPPIAAIHSPGMALPQTTRARFENRFGFDFSRVRIHADRASGRAAEALRARAFTIGTDIAFAPGQYRPSEPEGTRLLAHELAHVVQQSRGGAAPALDADSTLEHGARQAANAFTQNSGPVPVAGASQPGIARDIFDIQERHDREDTEPQHFILMDPRHWPSLNSEEWKRQLRLATSLHFQLPLRLRHFDEIKSANKPAPKPPEPEPPEPEKPAPVAAVPAQPVAPATEAPGDPQVTTPTSPYVGYMGASNLDPWHVNANAALGWSGLGTANSASLNTDALSIGLPKSGPIGWAVAGSRAFGSGNSTTTGYLNPFYAPDDKRYNLGLYLGAAGATGQRPPGKGGTEINPSAVAAAEALLGGPTRDSPRLTLGANLGASYNPYMSMNDPRPGAASGSNAYLHSAWGLDAALSAQYSPWYYHKDADPAAESKTPKLTLFGESAYSRTSGPVFSSGPDSGAAGSSSSFVLGTGVAGNLRLHDGATIFTGGLHGGYRWQRNEIGGSKDDESGAYLGGFIGASWR